MSEIERIPFDFSGDDGLEAVNRLEDIICSGNWGIEALNYQDEQTVLLLRLLQIGGIAVYKRTYTQQEASPEVWHRAEEFNDFIRKRHVGYPLLDVARIFYEHKYDGSRTEYNSLFFPELKAFVRCGGLPPEKLLGFFERDGCEMVILFPDVQFEDGDVYFAFTLSMPKELFHEAVEQMRKRTLETLREKLQEAEEKRGSIAPPYNMRPESE